MSDIDKLLAKARITPDGTRRSADELHTVYVFVLDAGEVKWWFDLNYKFAENGNDFRVVIHEFGFIEKMSHKRQIFDAAEEKRIMNFIRSYFLSDLPKGRFPFDRASCLEVIFSLNWIKLKINTVSAD